MILVLIMSLLLANAQASDLYTAPANPLLLDVQLKGTVAKKYVDAKAGGGP